MNTNKLKASFVLHGLTYGDVASKMGINKCTLSAKMNGHNQFTLQDVKSLMSILGLSAEEAVDIFITDTPKKGR